MNPNHLLTLTGTLTHRSGEADRDEYNNPVPVETTAEVACWIEQAQRSEDSVDADQQTETWKLYLPAGTVVSGADRLTVAGAAYELLGPPWPATNPRTGVVSHVEATARRVV